MPEYRSKPTECEAMRWAQDGCYDSRSNEHLGAESIVSWVNANGGEACLTDGPLGPKIAVQTINGTAYAAPGHYVIRGQARFCSHIEYGQPEHQCDGLIDFYPCDPETFERRWEQAD